MKNRRNLCLLLSATVAFTALLTGCVKHPDAGPDIPKPGEGTFDYATTVNIPVSVDYSRKGNKALFEIYTENPLEKSADGTTVKKEGVQSILKAYTDDNSRYAGVVNLPTAADKVWLYSESYGLPTCVEAEVNVSGISFELNAFLKKLEAGSQQADKTTAASASSTRGGSTPENIFNIQTTLGGYDRNGMPDYLEATLADVPEGLMNRIQHVLLPGTDNSEYAKPADLVNIALTQEASLTLVFLSELAQWTNSIGYYCYDTKNPPTTLDAFLNLPKYVVFPNCSMYNSSEDLMSGYFPPMQPGMQVKLKYYGKDGQASYKFPAGITVGWFIMPKGFNVGWSQIVNPTNFAGFKCSNSIFNNMYGPEQRVCVSLYDTKSTKTVIGFEDGADNDYKDVMFYLESDPGEAIVDPDRPVIDPGEEEYPDVAGDPLKGTLAFEDLWPSQGDYDMNDVVIAYNTTFTTNRDNKLIAITDVFTPLHDGGTQNNAFGYQLDIPVTAVESVTVDNANSSAQTVNGLETRQDKAVVMLFDNIDDALKQGPITVTMELDGSISMDRVTRKTLYNPFICVSGSKEGFTPGAIRKEVHLTNYAPTALADLTCFGLGNDKSTVDKGGNPVGPYYYVTSDSHPFAIDLPITDYRIPAEKVKIDDYYPGFAGWVTSNGEKNKEWYLRPAK